MLHKPLHKYIQRRGNVYHFRWRVPADLRQVFGATELTCSLHTLDCLQASVRAGRLIVIVARIKDIRRAHLFQEIEADEYVSGLKQLWISACSMARKKEKTIKTGLITSGDMTFDFGGDIDKELEAVAKAKEMGLISSIAELKPSGNSSSMMFSELFDGFLAHKMDKVEAKKETRKPLSDGQQKNHRRNFNTVIDCMEGDRPISTITQDMLKDAIITSGLLPRRNENPYIGVSVLELLEMEVPDKDRIRSKTAEEVRKTVQGIFAYAVKAKIIDSSPARDMGLKLDSSGTFAPYSREEVRQLLTSSFKEKKLWKKWLPTLAAYTGARRGELVQLRKEDIMFDTDSGRDYILITPEAGEVKSKNALRKIPLHPILKKSFLGFVKSVKTDRLFDGLDPQAVTKWFSGCREGLGIKRFDDYGNRKVFHSFRHTFITQSRGAGNPIDHVQQVVGHEKTSAGTTDRYSHIYPLSDVLGVVDKVGYEKP